MDFTMKSKYIPLTTSNFLHVCVCVCVGADLLLDAFEVDKFIIKYAEHRLHFVFISILLKEGERTKQWKYRITKYINFLWLLVHLIYLYTTY